MTSQIFDGQCFIKTMRKALDNLKNSVYRKSTEKMIDYYHRPNYGTTMINGQINFKYVTSYLR